MGGDNRSVRAFRQCLPGVSGTPQFYRIVDASYTWRNELKSSALLMDAQTGSEWSFQGCAVIGKLKGVCLDHLDVIKDYWFDWRNYNADTTVYGIKHKIR